MSSKPSHLRRLLEILTKSVEAIEVEADKQNVTYPNIDDPFNPTSAGEQFAMSPAVLQASMVGASAASQLVAALKIPGMTLFDRFMAFHVTSTLRLATEAGVVELLREHPEGLHIKDIGSKTHTDPRLMARVLRLLATHHVFREVKPNVFANNRISSMIDTGKPSERLVELTKEKYSVTPKDSQLFKNIQAEKYLGTSGVAAVLEHSSDEGYKSGAYLAEYVLGNDQSLLPFMRGMNTTDKFFEHLDKPENQGYMARMAAAFEGASKLEPITAIVQGFDWTALPDSALVVDLGGGNGSVAHCVAEAAPQLNIVVEDRPVVIENVAKPGWATEEDKKKLVSSGRVRLEAHDFFQPQPSHLAGKVDVFLLRFIIHDWPNGDSLKILRNLHAAAAPQGRLLIVDQIVPYACPAPDVGKDIPGGTMPPPPSPLLANLGLANTMVYYADMNMMNFLGSQERTLGEFLELTSEAGWKIVKVYRPPGSSLQQIECVKA